MVGQRSRERSSECNYELPPMPLLEKDYPAKSVWFSWNDQTMGEIPKGVSTSIQPDGTTHVLLGEIPDTELLPLVLFRLQQVNPDVEFFLAQVGARITGERITRFIIQARGAKKDRLRRELATRLEQEEGLSEADIVAIEETELDNHTSSGDRAEDMRLALAVFRVLTGASLLKETTESADIRIGSPSSGLYLRKIRREGG